MKDKQFVTTDLYIAAILNSFGYEIRVEKVANSKISNFVIDDIDAEEYEKIQSISNAYWRRELMVEPYDYIKNYKRLKDLSHQK